EYLLSLAASRSAKRRTRPRQETVRPGIRQLLGALNLPAFAESRIFDVLAANSLATALSPSMRAGENRLRSMFLDPTERDRHPDWPRAIGSLVASFRASIGTDTDDPRVAQLVGELSLASEPFRKLWARHDVKALAGATVQMRHPEVGELSLRREKLPIGDSGGQLLVIYHAAPGSESALALSLLARAVPAQSGAAEGQPAGVTGPAAGSAASGSRAR